MYKNLFLKLMIFLLPIFLISCNKKDTSKIEDNHSNSSVNQIVNSKEIYIKESAEAKVKIKEDDNYYESEIQEELEVSREEESKEDSTNIQEESESYKESDVEIQIESEVNTEDEEVDYYSLIKEAWNNQKEYVDSFEDPNIKQSLQTPFSAAINKSTELLLSYPDNYEAINESLKKVLAGE